MRLISSVTLLILCLTLVASPLSETPPALGQAAPTATETPSVATATATATTTPSAASTATATPAVTATATGVAAGVVVTTVSPTQGSSTSSMTIAISGSGFIPGAVVSLDGIDLPTTFASPNTLTAIVPAGLPGGAYGAAVRLGPASPPSATLPSAYTVINLQNILFIPVVARQSSENGTAIYVQNLSNFAATIFIRYYDTNGRTDPAWGRSLGVNANGSAIFDQTMETILPNGFDGSAVIQSADRITAVVNRVNNSGAGSLTGGDARASAGAFSIAPTSPISQATIPVTFGGYRGYTTTISVQNTGRSAATYALALFPTGSATAAATIQRVIPALASARVRLDIPSGVPAEFVGTVSITSGSGTLAAASETLHAESGVLLSYSAFAAGSTVTNAPLLFKNYNGWISGAQVVNTSSAAVTVGATIHPRDGFVSYTLASRTLAPNESYTYYLPAIPELPDDFVGSGVFTASGPIALVVQVLNADRGTGMAYSGFSGGTSNISIPVVFKGFNGWDTGVQVQNLGGSDAVVNVTYRLPSGAATLSAALVPAGTSETFYQPANQDLPQGLVGSAIVTSSGGQPIVAIVNEVNYLRNGDASMTYEGINY